MILTRQLLALYPNFSHHVLAAGSTGCQAAAAAGSRWLDYSTASQPTAAASSWPAAAAASSPSRFSSPSSSAHAAQAAAPSPQELQLGKNTSVLAGSSPSWPVQPQEQQLCPAKYKPWDPTRQLTRQSAYRKRMGFLMQTLEEEQVQALKAQRNFPDFASGDILELRMVVPENQRRQYIFQGVCIARYNKGIRSAFKIYNVFPDAGGVVQHIPLYMPDLLDIKVIGKVHAGTKSKKYHILENSSSKYSFQKAVRPFKEDANTAAAAGQGARKS